MVLQEPLQEASKTRRGSDDGQQQRVTQNQALKIANDAGKSKTNFANLIAVYLAGPYRVTQRAAWPISLCVERDPSIITPHLTKLLRFLSRKEIHPAVKRNTMRLLQFTDIPKRLHGTVVKLCFEYLTNEEEPIAVRVFAMTVLSRLTNHHPDLGRELALIIKKRLPFESAAFRSRGSKILRQMEH